jgi:hypothetical protein
VSLPQILTLNDIKGDPIENVLAKAASLAPGDQPRLLNNSIIETNVKRVNLTVYFDEREGRYIMSNEDQNKLYNYNIDYADFLKTSNEIENNITLRPFDHKQPKWR